MRCDEDKRRENPVIPTDNTSIKLALNVTETEVLSRRLVRIKSVYLPLDHHIYGRDQPFQCGDRL